MPTISKRRKPPVRRHVENAAKPLINPLPPLPLTPDHWRAICRELRLSPKNCAVLELILRDQSVKQIARQLDMAASTVKTHLQRISARTKTRGRMQLAMHVLATSHKVKGSKRRPVG